MPQTRNVANVGSSFYLFTLM